MSSVRLVGVSKRFGGVAAVDRLDLEVLDQELLVVLGPSGCGKTTTMRIVAGLETVDEGDVFIGELRVNDLPPKDRGVAMVFESYALYPHMSVFRNIEYPLKIRRMAAAQRRERILAVSEKLQLSSLLDRLPRQLSGGQRQRVALARAIVREPSVFLMDEPLSNLDAKLRFAMRSELKHLQTQLAVTTIYVTHDQDEAMTLADRIAIFDEGRLQQLGSPVEIYEDPANLFVAGFVGSPPMNLFEGRLENGRFVGPSLVQPTPLATSSREVVLGVRAQHMALTDGADEGVVAGQVYSTEFTGETTWINIATGHERVVIQSPRKHALRTGDVVWVRLAAEHVLLFDRLSGVRLRG